jgi:hypothetical protein
MSNYPPDQVVKEAMESYFKANNLGEDGGLNKMWAKIKVGKIYLPLLNIPARKKVLVLHDIHHIATGYAGDWKGEVSISAWEISTGCGKYWVAWVLDLWAMAIGLFIYPKDTFKAFIRGRRTRNLYKNTISKETALSMKINELRELLLLNQQSSENPSSKEIRSFTFYSVLAFITFLIPFVISPICLFLFLKLKM